MIKTNKLKGKYNKTSFLESFKNGLKPDDPITVSQFTEKHIYLPENSAMPGLINLDITPYFRKPLDDLTPGNKIKKIVVIGCVQIGKSNLGLCFGLSMMKISPGNTMFVLPRIGDAEDFSTERLTPMIKASPILADLIKMTGKSPDNKVAKKTYKGGFIFFAGAQSAASFRSKPIRFLYMDEIDEYPPDCEGQGSPIALAENRTVSFKDTKKIVYTSTPTDENSLINKEYEKGTKERYYCPCPKCGGFQSLKFLTNLKYETVDNQDKELVKDSVYYECEFCQHKIKEVYKRDMLVNGEWRADKPDADFPSYRLNALYSPFITWDDTVKKYLLAKKEKSEMKTFVNTYLGEIYEEEQSKLDSFKLYQRTKNNILKELELDPRVICLTGAVDTQDDRLVIDIKGWGKNEECWTVYYKEIYGNTEKDDNVWNTIKEIVERPFKHPSGIDLYVRYCAIDAGGHRTQKVYDFCSKNPKFKAIMGSRTKQKTLLSVPRKQDIIYRGTHRKDGIDLSFVGTEIAKEEIYYRLSIEQEGAKYIHFNKDLDQRYFDMLISEKCITVYKKGYPFKEWKLPSGARNESLDTFVYNFAIARALCHIELLDDKVYEEQYKEMFGDFGKTFLKEEKNEEDLIKEQNIKKIETINKLAKKTKNIGGFKNGGGFMKKYNK